MGRMAAHSGIYQTMYKLGLIKHWKSSHMKGGSYLTATQIGPYKVEYVDEDTELQITFWNPDRPCVVAVLLKEMDTAVLNIVQYDTRCTVDGRMEKGTRDMITFAIRLLKEKGAKTIQLDDRSTVLCRGKEIKLGPTYFFRTGETWYERYFRFQPIRNKELYLKAKEIQKTLGVSGKECDYFTDDVVYDLAKKTGFDRVTDYGWELRIH
jgi:hypothetical protein